MQVRLTALGLLCALLMSAAPAAAACDATPGSERFARSGWGFGERNLRFQADTDIDSTNAETLELAWAFALDGGMSPHSYALVTEDTVFIGTQAGSFFALERDSGCVRWKREFRSSIRTAVIHAEVAGGARLVFGTGDGWVVAADAITGEQLWETEVRDHPHAIVTGTPVYHAGRVYAPVSSYELAVAMNAMYACCTFRGSLVALDAAAGISDRTVGPAASDKPMPGLHALEVETGVVRWPEINPDRCRGRKGCDSGISAAIVATPDLVLAGGLDGQVSVYDARTGDVV